MIFEKLTNAERLAAGAPLLVCGFVLHGLSLAVGLALQRARAAARIVHGPGPGVGAVLAGDRVPVSPVPWTPYETWGLLLLPASWWFGFVLGPADPFTKTTGNSLGEPFLVALTGVGYLILRRATERIGYARALHLAVLLALFVGACLLGWLMPELGLTHLDELAPR